MSFRPVVLAAASALVAGTLVTTTAQASQPSKSAEALAVDAAATLVASRAPALHASADDAFVQRQVISSAGLKYVQYDRTYKGLPVYGGDFVVATNDAGQVLTTSVAQDTAINLASVTPVLTKAKAESVATAARSRSATTSPTSGSARSTSSRTSTATASTTCRPACRSPRPA
jgi:Zn-dependent metalloprotease